MKKTRYLDTAIDLMKEKNASQFTLSSHEQEGM